MNNHHHEHHEKSSGASEVQVNTTYNSGCVTITIRDLHNQPVDLTETHEKKIHLIIVSADLENFIHVHPIENESGDYEVDVNLPEGRYLAFVDINPVGLNYTIEPNTITVGESFHTAEINWETLIESDRSTKEFEGKKVTFQRPQLIAGKSATLSFDLNNETPLPYLGALGHVVVLDEHGKQFLHVHPISSDQTVFEANFPSAGFYKLWAEFNFSDLGVMHFPFAVKVFSKDTEQ